MHISKEPLSPELHASLVEYCFDIIGCMHAVYKELSPGMPEPVFQESLLLALHEIGYVEAVREYVHHPVFRNQPLKSHIQLDIMVPKQGRNIVIECKSIMKLGDKERIQLYGYLRGTGFKVGILVNFGSYPKAEIERYYYDPKTNSIKAF